MEENGPWFDESLLAQNSDPGRTVFSEWVEQEGRHWEDGPSSAHVTSVPDWGSTPSSSKSNLDYDTLSAFFAISVAAAGWHSGALVLVDEAKAEEARGKWIITKHSTLSVPGSFEEAEPHVEEDYCWAGQKLPRIHMPNGHETTGLGPLLPWRESMPTMSDLGLPSEPGT